MSWRLALVASICLFMVGPLLAEGCSIVNGVLTLAENETCRIDEDHPSVLQGLVMGKNSTVVVRNAPDNNWRIHIKKASFASGARWDLQGEPVQDWTGTRPSTPKQASYCNNGREGKEGARGANGNPGVGLDLLIGLTSLEEWRIDGSGGAGGSGGPGGKGAKGGAAKCGCQRSGDGGRGGRGGVGGQGGDTSEIRIRYYWVSDGPLRGASTSVPLRLEGVELFSDDDLIGLPQVDGVFPGGLNFDSEVGLGGAGGSGAGGGKKGERANCGLWVTGKGKNGGNGKPGVGGNDGEYLLEQVTLLNAPASLTPPQS